MGKKSQVAIIVSLLFLIIVIVLGVYVFYNVWVTPIQIQNTTNTNNSEKLIVTKVINTNSILVNDKEVTLLCLKPQQQGDYYYNNAISYLSGLILNKEVVIENGGFIWLDGSLINQNLVKNGYARYDGNLPNNTYCQAIQQSESTAKVSGVGLWRVVG